MAKVFNVTAVCTPDRHYMVNIDGRLAVIKKLIDDGMYFTINRARQYGKTTTLRALGRYLQAEYYVVSMDFQMFDAAKFQDGHIFSVSFANSFLRELRRSSLPVNDALGDAMRYLKKNIDAENRYFTIKELFEGLSDICGATDKPIVLMIDEVDNAADNQVFMDFLSQLRAYYIDRDIKPAFRSVILASVYDIKNLRRKLRPEDGHKVNSPWNIAADFPVDMSLPQEGIAGMLWEYEGDYHTGMDVDKMAELLYGYTSGYPFLVSRLCKLMDEQISGPERFGTKTAAWTRNGFNEAVRILLAEKNTLFESLTGKLELYPEFSLMLRGLLFTGKSIAYNPDEPAIDMATMFGFIKERQGGVEIANRIFEMRLYNLYLSAAKMQGMEIYRASLQDKSQFIVDGHLNMRRILEKFVEHFHELYGDRSDAFKEDEGRTCFLLYLRPIINGTGNYYIESRTRGLRRTDVIVDYHGEQYVIELKIWHGQKYHNRGEKQLAGYLDDYQQKKGYLLSFNFNQKKEIGVREIVIGDKILIEATV